MKDYTQVFTEAPEAEEEKEKGKGRWLCIDSHVEVFKHLVSRLRAEYSLEEDPTTGLILISGDTKHQGPLSRC